MIELKWLEQYSHGLIKWQMLLKTLCHNHQAVDDYFAWVL